MSFPLASTFKTLFLDPLSSLSYVYVCIWFILWQYIFVLGFMKFSVQGCWYAHYPFQNQLSFFFFFLRQNGPASAAPLQEGRFWKRSETKKRILRVAQSNASFSGSAKKGRPFPRVSGPDRPRQHRHASRSFRAAGGPSERSNVETAFFAAKIFFLLSFSFSFFSFFTGARD